MPHLLDKIGLINDQHSICIADLLNDILAQNVPCLFSIPMRAPKQVLHAIGRGIANELDYLPAALALGVAQQPLQIPQHLDPLSSQAA